MSDAYSKLVFRDDSGVYLRLVTDITVYWRGSLFEHAESVLSLYREALLAVGREVKWFRTESMTRSKAVTETALEFLPRWLKGGRRTKGIYMLSLESAEERDEPSDRAFYFLADEEEDTKVGMIRLILPAGAMDGGISSTLPLVKSLLGNLDFESGHAGYAVNWDPEGDSEDEASRVMTHLAGKYPGVDLNYVDSTLIAFEKSSAPSIKCANWLTLVGGGIASRLPSPHELAVSLAEGCTVHPLAKGLLLQAGPSPRLGYPDRTELEPYRRVGRLLSDFRLRDHPQIFAESPGGAVSTEDWLARFDT